MDMTDYKHQVWRVNVRNQTLSLEPVPETWVRLGGRGLLARIMLDEVDAKCDPLGAGSKLIFVPGLLEGRVVAGLGEPGRGVGAPGQVQRAAAGEEGSGKVLAEPPAQPATRPDTA